MAFHSISDWLLEQEHRRQTPVFLVEWVATFAFALLFWAALFYELEYSFRSTATAATLAALYACCLVYLRIFPLTRCPKCKSLLPFVREEVGRRHLHDEERCHEIVRGGEEYWGHFIDLYYRIYVVDVTRYRCVKCHAFWEEVERVPKSAFRLARTIRVKD